MVHICPWLSDPQAAHPRTGGVETLSAIAAALRVLVTLGPAGFGGIAEDVDSHISVRVVLEGLVRSRATAAQTAGCRSGRRWVLRAGIFMFHRQRCVFDCSAAARARWSCVGKPARTAILRPVRIGSVGFCRSEEHTSELQSLRHLVC